MTTNESKKHQILKQMNRERIGFESFEDYWQWWYHTKRPQIQDEETLQLEKSIINEWMNAEKRQKG